MSFPIVHRLVQGKGNRGLSLIEVMASVLIMGTLATTMLTSMAASVKQVGAAQNQLTASHIARELLAEWKLRGDDLTVAAAGSVAIEPEWSWARSAQPREVQPGLMISEVTLTVERKPNEANAKSWRHDFRIWIRNNAMAPDDPRG